MKIRGEFRDILSRNGVIIEDRGWKSNSIAADFGKFLAAVMKKDFPDDSNNTIKPVGIEYIAVGSKSESENEFRNRIKEFFTAWNKDNDFDPKKARGDPWIWVKKIKSGDITYLNAADNKVTHRLQISVDFLQNEPEPDSDTDPKFEEFALLGILQRSDNKFDIDRMFLINHAAHGRIDKAASMTIKRTVNLIFPVNQEEAVR